MLGAVILSFTGNVSSSMASIDYEQSLFLLAWSVEQNAREKQMENGVIVRNTELGNRDTAP